MNLIQKAICQKIEVEYNNCKMHYKNKYFFHNDEKECMINNLHVDEMYSYKKKNKVILFFGIIFLVFSLIVLYTVYSEVNSLDNFLFWFIPCVICWTFYFITARNMIVIESDFGDIELIKNDRSDVLNLLNQLESDFELMINFNDKEELFYDKLNRLKNENNEANLKFSEKITFIATNLNKSKCPLCNMRSDVNVIKLHKVKSLFIFTSLSSEYSIGCKQCLKTAKKEFNISSLFLGLWSLPAGLLGTPIVMLINTIRVNKIKNNIPTSDFRSYLMEELKK